MVAQRVLVPSVQVRTLAGQPFDAPPLRFGLLMVCDPLKTPLLATMLIEARRMAPSRSNGSRGGNFPIDHSREMFYCLYSFRLFRRVAGFETQERTEESGIPM